MSRLLTMLLLSVLLASCGGGGNTGGEQEDDGPESVTGHFFTYVSDGSSIYAINDTSSEINLVTSLTSPTEDLPFIKLAERQGLLNDRVISWADIMYVDAGRLYLLPAHSSTENPPSPRQLSNMNNIDTSCGLRHSVSADGQHEGLLLFVPDDGEACTSKVGSSYLLTTDMSTTDAPVIRPAPRTTDFRINRISKGISSTIGFVGIRDEKLVLLDTALQVKKVLQNGIAHIDSSIQPTVSHPNRMLLNITSVEGQSHQHFLDLATNTLLPALGVNLSSPFFSWDHVYGSLLQTAFPTSSTKIYIAGLNGEAARDLGCAAIEGYPRIAGLTSNGLLVLDNQMEVLALNPETCEQQTLLASSETRGIVLSKDNHVYINAYDKASFIDMDVANMQRKDISQAKAESFIFTRKANRFVLESFVLLSNLDHGDGSALRIESYSTSGEHIILGELDSNITNIDVRFGNSSGHKLSLGTISFENSDGQRQTTLYSLDPEKAGSLKPLMSRDFLQKL